MLALPATAQPWDRYVGRSASMREGRILRWFDWDPHTDIARLYAELEFRYWLPASDVAPERLPDGKVRVCFYWVGPDTPAWWPAP